MPNRFSLILHGGKISVLIGDQDYPPHKPHAYIGGEGSLAWVREKWTCGHFFSHL